MHKGWILGLLLIPFTPKLCSQGLSSRGGAERRRVAWSGETTIAAYPQRGRMPNPAPRALGLTVSVNSRGREPGSFVGTSGGRAERTAEIFGPEGCPSGFPPRRRPDFRGKSTEPVRPWRFRGCLAGAVTAPAGSPKVERKGLPPMDGLIQQIPPSFAARVRVRGIPWSRRVPLRVANSRLRHQYFPLQGVLAA